MVDDAHSTRSLPLPGLNRVVVGSNENCSNDIWKMIGFAFRALLLRAAMEGREICKSKFFAGICNSVSEKC